VTVLAATAVAVVAADKQLALVLFGGYIFGDLLWDAWKTQDRKALFLGLWLLLPLPIVYYGHFPIKYLLPCMPALILTCLRLGAVVPERIARTASILLILGGITYSMLILRSDAEFADFGRDALNALIRPHVLAGEKVWFPSQYSAYWYARPAGAELVVPGFHEPNRGDLLAVGISEGGTDKLEKFPNRTLVQTLTHRYSFGKTMGEGAGLYTNWGGTNWLWTFRNSEPARYELWRLD
jgi:hypothetical protein